VVQKVSPEVLDTGLSQTFDIRFDFREILFPQRNRGVFEKTMEACFTLAQFYLLTPLPKKRAPQQDAKPDKQEANGQKKTEMRYHELLTV
jgi:hypothetical protein